MQQELSYKLHYRNHFPINSNLATTDITTSHRVVLPTLMTNSANTWNSSQNSMAVSVHLTTSFIFHNCDFAQTMDTKLIPQYFNFNEIPCKNSK